MKLLLGKKAGARPLMGKTLQIGSYSVKVMAVLGEGGLATVYKAIDGAGVAFAVKHMRLADEQALADVTLEAQTLTALQGHPNIVRLAATAVSGPQGAETDAYMLLEYCPSTLPDMMQESGWQLSEAVALSVFSDVCAAVAHMHAQSPQIAHRDLKTENVLRSAEGRWVLCDYGSSTRRAQVYETTAQIAQEEENIRRNTTPAYRAPEMWDLYSRQRIDEKVDVWALGVLLYVLLCGKLPFGDQKLAILNGRYDAPAGTSEATGMLLRRLLTVDPSARPCMRDVLPAVAFAAAALSGHSQQQPLPALLLPPDAARTTEQPSALSSETRRERDAAADGGEAHAMLGDDAAAPPPQPPQLQQQVQAQALSEVPQVTQPPAQNWAAEFPPSPPAASVAPSPADALAGHGAAAEAVQQLQHERAATTMDASVVACTSASVQQQQQRQQQQAGRSERCSADGSSLTGACTSVQPSAGGASDDPWGGGGVADDPWGDSPAFVSATGSAGVTAVATQSTSVATPAAGVASAEADAGAPAAGLAGVDGTGVDAAGVGASDPQGVPAGLAAAAAAAVASASTLSHFHTAAAAAPAPSPSAPPPTAPRRTLDSRASFQADWGDAPAFDSVTATSSAPVPTPQSAERTDANAAAASVQSVPSPASAAAAAASAEPAPAVAPPPAHADSAHADSARARPLSAQQPLPLAEHAAADGASGGAAEADVPSPTTQPPYRHSTSTQPPYRHSTSTPAPRRTASSAASFEADWGDAPAFTSATSSAAVFDTTTPPAPTPTEITAASAMAESNATTSTGTATADPAQGTAAASSAPGDAHAPTPATADVAPSLMRHSASAATTAAASATALMGRPPSHRRVPHHSLGGAGPPPPASMHAVTEGPTPTPLPTTDPPGDAPTGMGEPLASTQAPPASTPVSAGLDAKTLQLHSLQEDNAALRRRVAELEALVAQQAATIARLTSEG